MILVNRKGGYGVKKAIAALFAAVVCFSFAHSSNAASMTYTVKKGDTLWKIANTYKTTVDNIKKWNHLTSNNIALGTKLIIQSSSTISAKNPFKTSEVNSASGKVIVVKATAYTASCKGCSGVTALGINLKQNPNAKVIAVDPNVIPLGSKVYVEGYGQAIAGDKGSAIKGNRIDVYVPSIQSARNWGVRTTKVTILQ
ncbi:MAG: LysM peptidoglycan-binding domain-containing protein [Bacillales bacterium]|nr:LysM peptidoglycan-binding domain-containing protein [Bacillales bacterium]